MKNVGFIGAGNMGSALMAQMKELSQLRVYDILPQACEKAEQSCNAIVEEDIPSLVKHCDLVFLAVKPQFLMEVLPTVIEHWEEGKILCSIVAGKSIEYYETAFLCKTKALKVARIMPNTPALVGEAMNTLCFSKAMDKGDQQVVTDLLLTTGKVKELRESQMDAAMGIAGCSPAYVYMFIEALADAGVYGGIFRKDAIMMAAQTVLGAAKMVLETGEHPEKLKDDVCSPAGTTIKGVMALEEGGFRASIEKAVKASMSKDERN